MIATAVTFRKGITNTLLKVGEDNVKSINVDNGANYPMCTVIFEDGAQLIIYSIETVVWEN